MTNGLLDQCPSPNDTPACPRVSHLMTSLGRNTTTSQLNPRTETRQKCLRKMIMTKPFFFEVGWTLKLKRIFLLLTLSLYFPSIICLNGLGWCYEVKRENLVNIPGTCLCRLTGPGNMDLWLLQVRMITIGLSKKNIFTIQPMAAKARKTINCRYH